MTAWIPVLIALLPTVQTGVTEFIAWLNSLVGAAQQAGEWTPEQDAAYRAALFAKTQDPAYKPDA
jgi:hypothetical protein